MFKDRIVTNTLKELANNISENIDKLLAELEDACDGNVDMVMIVVKILWKKIINDISEYYSDNEYEDTIGGYLEYILNYINKN